MPRAIRGSRHCAASPRVPHPIPSHRVEGGDIPGGVNGSSLGLPSLPPSLAHLAAQLQLQLQDRSWHSSCGERELLAVFLGEGWYWTVKKTKRAQANGGRSWTAWKLGPEIGGGREGSGLAREWWRLRQQRSATAKPNAALG